MFFGFCSVPVSIDDPFRFVLSFHGFQTTNQLTQIYLRIFNLIYICTYVVHIFLYQGCLPQLNIVYGLMAEQNHWRLGFSGWVWRDCRDHFSSFVLVKPVQTLEPPYVCSWNPEPQFFLADIDIPICLVFITISCAKISMYFHIVQYIPIHVYIYTLWSLCMYTHIYIYIIIKYIYIHMSIIFPFPHIRWLYHHQLPIQPMPHPP